MAPSLLRLTSVRTDDWHPKVLVISPLIALIMDNISKVEEMNLGKAINLESASEKEIEAADFIFSTPECLLNGEGRAKLLESHVATKIQLICVDECHVVVS